MDDERDERPAGILAGVRVVEVAAWVAGPAAAGILADWGADVIKVEPATGDPQRNVFGAVGVAEQTAMPPFEIDNRGKRSVVLDLRRDRDRAEMERLLATADVFVTNMRLKALERLGLDPAGVRARHPRIIYGIITGYGLTGPDADRPGYDIGAFWARSSLAASVVPKGRLPPAIRSGLGDHVTGMTLVGGIAAALFDRARTGRGHLVSTSLLRTGIYAAGWDIGTLLRFGKLSSTRSREQTSTPLMNCYQAGDGHGFWLLGLEADRHWPGLVAATERDDLGADDRFATARDRYRNAEALIAELDVTFAGRTMGEWIARFDAHDVWWAPINTARSVVDDEQAIAAGAFVEMSPREGEAPFRAVASPVDFDDAVARPGPVPHLGEHTTEVLAALPTPPP
jgi:crotonobetainyl-CoA:carnitine CoA-transferase CaiB-like acyl-CoA transferase